MLGDEKWRTRVLIIYAPLNIHVTVNKTSSIIIKHENHGLD